MAQEVKIASNLWEFLSIEITRLMNLTSNKEFYPAVEELPHTETSMAIRWDQQEYGIFMRTYQV